MQLWFDSWGALPRTEPACIAARKLDHLSCAPIGLPRADQTRPAPNHPLDHLSDRPLSSSDQTVTRRSAARSRERWQTTGFQGGAAPGEHVTMVNSATRKGR